MAASGAGNEHNGEAISFVTSPLSQGQKSLGGENQGAA